MEGENMNKFLVIIALAAGMVAHAAPSQGDEPMEREVLVSVADAYMPGGFDSSSDAYVVANGIFPNGCYRWKRADVTHKNKVHEVRSIASVRQGMCIMVLVPFTKEVRLGRLEAGDHAVRFINADGTYLEKELSVEQ